jgi:hypothetical protein
MQLNPLDAATVASALQGSAPAARVVAGDLAAVPVGELLNAVVTSVSPREAVLNVSGQSLTIRTPPGQQLQPGAALFVRVSPATANGPNPTIELSVPQPPGTAQRSLAPAAGGGAQVAARGALPDVSAGSARAQAARGDAPALPPPRLAVVDVIAPLPDGRVRVQLDGVEQVATAVEPLAAGSRFVLQVERTPAGIRLSPPPPQNPPEAVEVATAVLRTPAPTLPATLKSLQAELATLTAPPKPTAPPVPTPVREAAAAVETTLRTLVPPRPVPPDASQLRQLIESGGLHYEAKLARLVEGPTPLLRGPAAALVPSRGQPDVARVLAATVGTPTTAPSRAADPGAPAVDPSALVAELSAFEAKPSIATKPGAEAKPNLDAKPSPDAKLSPEGPKAEAPKAEGAKGDNPKLESIPARADATPEARGDVPAAKVHAAVAGDLKGDLLRLLQAVNDAGQAARAPAAEAALRGIEAQQAANTIAQANNTPYFLQVPFPDRGEWKTLSLSLEPQHRPDQADAERAGRFRVFMHVPLNDLGETWIDAGLSGDRFRATIYLDRAEVRDRVRAALPELNAELTAEGFSEVLLDVRSSGELPAGRRRAAGATQAGRPDAISVLDVRA